MLGLEFLGADQFLCGLVLMEQADHTSEWPVQYMTAVCLAYPSIFNAEMDASCGISTLPG